ncbi:isoleucyl-tRNA ligase [Fictibacillus macauensis ZFHKF-1]|uniref:Isoleucyl-tRNA ligase n=1 Tax=Fictibacillus macauensis ZFHKF-1 TaxID=1196324 RepID=I8UKL7_9BACL|nr:DUF5915 domain-containing protein [Fictibacillus macauensis]EIT87373.1 isoleucyl-tRNA ligase [Fictibacillus macauensis ZFHKF-1]
MDAVRNVIELARSARNAAAIKTKQPLSVLTVVGEEHEVTHLKKYEHIVKEEINVKQVVWQSEMSHDVQYEMSVNFRVVGPKFGSDSAVIKALVAALSQATIVKAKTEGFCIVTTKEGKAFTLEKEDFDVRTSTKPGLEMASNLRFSVLLNTVLTDELRDEGVVRELIRAVQQYRKALQLPVEERIHLVLDLNPAMQRMLEEHKALFLSNLVLTHYEYGTTPDMKHTVIDGVTVGISVK